MCMDRTQIMLPPPLREKIKTKAKEKGISMGELIRRILDAWSEDHDK